MRTNRKSIAITFAVLSCVLLGACKDHREDEERQAQTSKRPTQISWENGQAILTLDSPTQVRLGLATAVLSETESRTQVTVPAVVLSVQNLATFLNSYSATHAQLDKSRIELGVARNEYTRLKTLFDENQNVSEKSLQSAQAALQTSEADVRAVDQQLSLQESIVRQEWGSVVAAWAVNGAPELQRVFDQQDALLRITIPKTDKAFAPSKTIALDIPGGIRAQASFVSPLPKVDPRIQGRTFLYLAPAQSGLAPDINLLARLTIGAPMQGLIVPASAVIWSEGKPWVYQQIAADHFTRRSVATDVPVEQGFFVAQGFSPGDKIVVRGAQALLSEELLLHGQGGGETDVD